jgi:hypothetical protein
MLSRKSYRTEIKDYLRDGYSEVPWRDCCKGCVTQPRFGHILPIKLNFH